MLNFLGITRHLSTTAGYAKRIGWLLHEDVTQSPFPVTGVSFTGAVKTEQGDLPIAITHGEQENYLELTFPALPIGRWPYAIHAQDESGEDLRLFAGYIGAVESVPPIEASTVYDIPVMGIAIPIEAGKTIKAQWLSNTAASLAAQQAQQDASSTRTDADTASQAATTATGAATTAVERAKEAEGYADSAYVSKVAAGNSATAANTSAADAARDAKTAKDAKTAVEGIVSDFTQTVSNGEQTISAAKEEAVTVIQAKQADSVLAVGRAQKTATDKVASAQGAAVTAVETAKTEAVEAITPLVEQAETAKEEIGQAEGRIKTAETNAGQSAQTASDAATTAQQALAAIPQVDEAGNMTLAGGLTTTGTHNANGGINIPLAVGAPTDTMGINRAYALGMAQLVLMHQTRTYWLTSSCTATNGVTINHVVPGLYCDARVGGNGRTSLTMCTTGVVGGGNYSKIMGYSLPVRSNGDYPGAWSKVSMLIGAGGEWTEYPDAGMDGYRFRPVSGSAPAIARLVEVTLYYQDGYKARVRELIGVGNPRHYVVRTTTSAINYDSNTGLMAGAYRLVIAQSEQSHSDALAAGVWLMIGGAANDTVLKLADIRGWDTYHVSSGPMLYLDVQAGEYGGVAQLESPTILNGIGNNTYVRYGLEPYQRSWITSVTEEPYMEPEQPAE